MPLDIGLEPEEKPVYDSVQGFVHITKCEKEIINSPFFQRLREVKQLGFACYVFPGATHNRLSHSIGVLAIVGKIIQTLKRNATNSDDNVGINDRDEKILRMAALLHDIGHYPFSHTIESAYKACHEEDVLPYFGDEDESATTSPRDSVLDARRDILTTTNGHHEELGAYIVQNTNFEGGITRILFQFGFERAEIADIASTICGKCQETWYNQILHSELDADRIDFLLRDSHATGVNYGHFDVEYLINNCRLIKDTTRNDQFVFGIKESAVFTVEHFLLARYFWYAQIINDRTICIFDEMAKKLYIWLIRNNLAYRYVDIINLIPNPASFIRFSDRYFWEVLDKLIDGDFDDTIEAMRTEGPYYKELAKLLVARKPFRKVDVLFDKKLSYDPTELDCEAASGQCSENPLCGKSKACPKRASSTTIEKQTYDDKLSPIKENVEELSGTSNWAIGTFGKVVVSKNYGDSDGIESERDPIRIIENCQIGHPRVQLLNNQKHSIIPELSERTLVIPRVYVREDLYQRVHDNLTSRE